MRRILKDLDADSFDGLAPRLDQAEQTLSRLRKAIRDYTALRQDALGNINL